MAKRCKDEAPRTGKRCKLDRGHGGPNHQNGDFVWPQFVQPLAEGDFPSVKAGPLLSFQFTPAQGEKPVDMTKFVRGVEFGDDRFRRVGNDNIMHSMCDTSCGSECDAARSREAAELELRGWWFDLAEKEIEGTVPKAIEYSSTDLVDIGRTLAFCMGRDVGDEEAAELGIFFYMQGKMSRWAGAIKTGKRVSDDTLFDIGVYVRMTQRVRAAGGWPGVTLEGTE